MVRQRKKVYVQDLIREQPKRVYHALADCQGLFYVCGYVHEIFPRAVSPVVISWVANNEQLLGKDASSRSGSPHRGAPAGRPYEPSRCGGLPREDGERLPVQAGDVVNNRLLESNTKHRTPAAPSQCG